MIAPSSPVNLPTLYRADELGDDMSYWLARPADAIDELDRIDCKESLLAFVRRMWSILEPGRQISVHWPLEAMCLPHDSEITTEVGPMRIGDLVESGWGGRVLSCNHRTGRMEWRRVTRHMRSSPKPLFKLILSDGSVLKLTGNHPVFVVGVGYVRADSVVAGQSVARVQTLRRKVPSGSSANGGARKGRILQPEMLRVGEDQARDPNLPPMWWEEIMGRKNLHAMQSEEATEIHATALPILRETRLSGASAVPADESTDGSVLQQGMLLQVSGGAEQRVICARPVSARLPKGFQKNPTYDCGQGAWPVLPVFRQEKTRRASHRQGYAEQRSDKSRGPMPELPCSAECQIASGDVEVVELIVRAVDREARVSGPLYNLEVDGNQNYIADGILVHNCEHLEAVTYGQIKRLLINVPPGFMKSLLCNCFWPAWEWGALGKTSMRYVSFSYSAHLTERDNRRFRDVMLNHDYGRLFGGQFALNKTGEKLVSNDKTGWKLASSVGGVGTGERGDRVVLDDPHNVKEGESEEVRRSTVTWFREAMNNRVNDRDSAIVVIMQRVHEEDVSGVILSELRQEYEHLCIPYEWEGQKIISTVPNMVWNEDPRTKEGQEAWPERLPMPWRTFRVTLGPYAVASQYNQRPSPRGGGIFKRDWWQVWDPPAVLQILPDGEERLVQKFPTCDFIIASLDGAFGQKQENDWTALTIWGIFKNAPGVLPASTRQQRPYLDQIMTDTRGKVPGALQAAHRFTQPPNLMLMHGWRKRLPLNGFEIERAEGESDAQFRQREMREWGIVQWVIYSCRRLGVNVLLVEAKANGIDVANEVRRQMGGQRFGVELIDPGRLDKVGRAYAVQHIWADSMVYAPVDEPDGTGFRDWADEVISEMAVFPKGGHDDYTDTATQVAKWLRDRGLLQHGHEIARELADEIAYKSTAVSKPLYPT